ncbi:MAG: hypothetical protein ACHQ7M_02665 [Chloroflexota bacterium]
MPVLVGGWLVAGRFHPAIPMLRHSVILQGAPDAVMRRIRSTFESGNVLVRQPDRLVARFGGKAGRFAFKTVELITFDEREVTFEHLGGTFLGCRERFVVTPRGERQTELSHEGWFKLRGGLAGWLLGVTVVRRLFVRHVEHTMASF